MGISGSLYGMVWLAFLEVWLAFTPIAPPVPYYLHAIVGLAIVAAAYSNFSRLRASTAPARIKRVVRATFWLAVLMAPLGAFLFSGIGADGPAVLGITVSGFVRFLHFLNAMAILTQASAAAIAFDMWEEKEFLEPSRPGEIPEPPAPVRTPRAIPSGPAGHGGSAGP